MVQEAVIQEKQNQAQGTECRHHWIIESPQGATSWGQCKICGARKEFPNSAGDALWERDSASAFSGRWSGAVRREPSLSRVSWVEQGEEGEGF